MSTVFRTNVAIAACLAGTMLGPATAFGAPVAFASLPESPAPWKPVFKTAPKGIAARERVPGFVVVRREGGGGLSVARAKTNVAVLEAAAFGEPGWCFGVNVPVSDADKERGLRTGWERYAEDASFPSSNSGPRIAAVRAERWLEGAEKARVEIEEFWVDLLTAGARKVRSSTYDIVRVATPSPGFDVYATRTGPDSVDFFLRSNPSAEVAAFAAKLVKAPPDSAEARALGALKNSFGWMSPMTLVSKTEDRMVSVSQCRHLHVELDAAYRQSELVGVQTQVIVGTPEIIEHDALPKPGGPLAPTVPPSAASIELRTLGLTLGLSRIASEKAPVPSVSYRWEDRVKEVEL